jgi:putative membrane protein
MDSQMHMEWGYTPWRSQIKSRSVRTVTQESPHNPKQRNIMKNTSIIRFSTSAFALCAALIFASNGMSAEKDTLNAADVKFTKQEAAASKAVVKIAELGVKKTGNTDIKALAATLVADHTQANVELKALAEKKGIELSAVIDPDSAETFQNLEKADGLEFDKEFLAAVVSGHKKCVANFEEASTESKDSDLKMWVEKMLPILKAHHAKAVALQGN